MLLVARKNCKAPALMLADEPTTNLDAKRGQEVVQLLRQNTQEMNKAALIAAHDHRHREMADRVFWPEDGRLRPES